MNLSKFVYTFFFSYLNFIFTILFFLARKGREYSNAQQSTISTTICEVRKRVIRPAVDPLRFTHTQITPSIQVCITWCQFNPGTQPMINCFEFLYTLDRNVGNAFSSFLLQTISRIIVNARSIKRLLLNTRFVENVYNDPVKT